MIAVVVVGATFIPFTVTGAQLGLLQGAERHKRLGALYVVATGSRVAGAIVGAAVAGTAGSTLVGLAVGATLGAVAGQFLLVGQPPWGSSEEGPREFLVEVGHAAHALIALYALTNLDVLLARAQLPAYDAGLYAAGALIARAVFFLPQAVLVAAFPRMVAGARNAQKQAIVAVAGLGLLSTLVVAALPRLIVRIMSGTQYLSVAQDAWIFALAGAGFGVVQVLLYARMAHHDRRATLLLWGGVAGLAALGLWLGTSIHALATVAASVAWASLRSRRRAQPEPTSRSARRLIPGGRTERPSGSLTGPDAARMADHQRAPTLLIRILDRQPWRTPRTAPEPRGSRGRPYVQPASAAEPSAIHAPPVSFSRRACRASSVARVPAPSSAAGAVEL